MLTKQLFKRGMSLMASAVMAALSAASLSVLWLCSVYLMLRSCTGIELWAICMSVMLGMLRRNR